MTRYKIRDQFGYDLGVVSATNQEEARNKAKKKYKKSTVRVMKIR